MGESKATLSDFQKFDLRVGTVVEARPVPEGRHSTHVLQIDFGAELGMRKSLARLTPVYTGPELIGQQVVCVVNFPSRQIGKHQSQVLTLGVPNAEGHVVLLHPEVPVPAGGRVH